MTQHSDDLFLLIKSLTKNEKGYFKKYSSIYSGKKNNNYLRLFQALDKQKVYDETAIKKKFAGERFAKQLNVTKKYLYQLILKSLYSSDRTTEAELKNMGSQIQVLLKKRLFNQCEKIIIKAKEIARRQEKNIELLNFFVLEESLMIRSGNHSMREHFLIREYQTIENIVLDIQQEIFYTKTSYFFQKLINKHIFFRDHQYTEDIEKLIKHPLLSDESKAISFTSKYNFFFIHSHYNQLIGNFDLSFYFKEKNVAFLESHPKRIKTHPGDYFTAINNLVIDDSSLLTFKEGLAYIEKMKSVRALTKSQEKRFFLLTHICLLHLHCKHEKYTEALPVIKILEKELSTTQPPQDIVAIYLYSALITFYSKKYLETVSILNKFFIYATHESFPQHYGFAKILQLIVHYELENYELTQSLIRSTYRYLCKKEILSGLEKIIISFIRKSFRLHSQKELTANALILQKEFLALKSDPKEWNIAVLFRLDRWLERKFLC